MRHNKHNLFSKHKRKISGKLRSSSMAASQKIGSSSKAKASSTRHETEAEEEGMEGNSEEDLEEPEDSHKGKGTPTLARQAVVASIKASSTSSKVSKAREETSRTKSQQFKKKAKVEGEERTEFKVMSLSIYPVGTYLTDEGYFPLQKPTKVYRDLTSLVDVGCAQIATIVTREPISKRRLGLFQEAIQKAKQMNVAPVTAFYTLNENTELSTEEDIIGKEGEEEDTMDEDQRDYQETKECKETEAEETTKEGSVHGNSEEEEELVEDALRPPFTQKRLRSESQPSGEDEHPAKKRKGKSHGSFRSYSSSERQSQTETEEAEEDTNTPKPRSQAFLRKTGSPHMRSILRNADRARKFFGVTVDEVEDDLGFRTDYSSDQEYASDLFQKPTPSTPQVNTSTASTSQASTSTSSNSMAAFLTYYKPPLSDKSRERLDPWKQV
ncbi:hypothetical protein C8R41DRAFT_920005 [Lentinula lateritia]|uniref:Uncharacterized protein n=1 Tax=Lentinula lateritia TaxID=40482 RepID=A0ABQ8VHM7_9AGAR|nr:hypothetical protein C8R41DRAFT_920005 [Lentinula lateritia]